MDLNTKLKNVGKFLYQTVRQSPDADLFLIGMIGSLFADDMDGISFVLGYASVKQYVWGWWMYNSVQSAIEEKEGQVFVKELKKRFNVEKNGPCSYFGTRYAINEYKKSLEETIE